MKLYEFLKQRLLYIISHTIVILLTVSVIWALTPGGDQSLSIFIGILYLIGAAVPLIIEYAVKRNFYKNLLNVFDSLDKKNLIAEIISPPSFTEGIILYNIIKGSNKAMIEEINKYKYMHEEYREYMEIWVHEIKTPIASSKLIAQNNVSDATKSIYEELEKIETFVEQVLFYSRSNTVEKDYIIKKINLQELCFNILKKNSKLFIHNKIGIQTENLDIIIYSDAKWFEFILNQILTNSIKYSHKPDPQIKIIAEEENNCIMLYIKDNGTGIMENELPRIFEKSFTGTNGRKNQRSTGMGLYICKKLCDKLGLNIEAYSTFGEGTTIKITIPKNSMTDII